MADKEKTGYRGQEFSAFHRTQSVARFLSKKIAREMSTIDLDAVPYVIYEGDYKPIALIETVKDTGQSFKQTGVMRALANMAKIPAWLVIYKVSTKNNPEVDPKLGPIKDIVSFRVKQVAPTLDKDFTEMTPKEYCVFEVNVIRKKGIENLEANHLDKD